MYRQSMSYELYYWIFLNRIKFVNMDPKTDTRSRTDTHKEKAIIVFGFW